MLEYLGCCGGGDNAVERDDGGVRDAGGAGVPERLAVPFGGELVVVDDALAAQARTRRHCLGHAARDRLDRAGAVAVRGYLDADVDQRDQVALTEPVQVVADLEAIDAGDDEVAVTQRFQRSPWSERTRRTG